MKFLNSKNKLLKKTLKKTLKVIGIIILVLFIIGLISGGVVWYKYGGKIKQAYAIGTKHLNEIDSDTFRRKGFTIIYDKNDKEIVKFSDEKYYYKMLKDIDVDAKNAFVACEDKRFLKHNGIDFKGLSRALYKAISSKGEIVQGGSTITQQLVKNVFLTQERRIQRKITEMYMAYKLEKLYNKEQILEYYLNNIYFGHMCYGIESASQRYLGKSSKSLTIGEAAFLAGLPNNPSIYDPINNYNSCIERMKLILLSMRDNGYIDQEAYLYAIDEDPIIIPKSKVKIENSYMKTYAVHCATENLMELNGFTLKNKFKSDKDKKKYYDNYYALYKETSNEIKSGGYRIYTSIDMDKQKMLQDNVNTALKDFTDIDITTKKRDLQGASIIINNKTSMVEAIVGGRDPKDQFNRAIIGYRQPGSTIKPLISYGVAFEKSKSPSSLMVDQSVIIDNGKHTIFGNKGVITLREAAERSLNSVSYQLVEKNGINESLDYLYKMNFCKIDRRDNTPIIGLGGLTYGAAPEEIAGAYETLANGGIYKKTTCIRKIVYKDNDDIYVYNIKPKRIYNEGTAWLMTDVLKGVLTKSYATGYNLKPTNYIAAAKTGTTNDNKDGWLAGYSKYYTTVVWVGNDNPKPLKGLYGATYPGAIWKATMDKLHENLAPEDFSMPSCIIEKNVNRNTGLYTNCNTGIRGQFSQISIDNLEKVANLKLQQEQKRKEEIERKKKADYIKLEPKREENARLLVDSYLKSDYITDINLSTTDALYDKTIKAVESLIDGDVKLELMNKINEHKSIIQQNKNILTQKVKEQQLKLDETYRKRLEEENKLKDRAILEQKEFDAKKEERKKIYEENLITDAQNDLEALEALEALEDYQDYEKIKSTVNSVKAKISIISDDNKRIEFTDRLINKITIIESTQNQ